MIAFTSFDFFVACKMNILCVICRDRFVPSNEIFSTHCGHVFHFRCLSQWLERSETCPQCRKKTTKSNIHKVYFNLLDNETVSNDTSIQARIDSLKFQVLLKEKNMKYYKSKTESLEKQKIGLRQEARKLEKEANQTRSNIQDLMSSIQYLKELCVKYEVPVEKWSHICSKVGISLDVKKIGIPIIAKLLKIGKNRENRIKGIECIKLSNTQDLLRPYNQYNSDPEIEDSIFGQSIDIVSIPFSILEEEAENQNEPSSSKTGTQKVSNEDQVCTEKAKGNDNDDNDDDCSENNDNNDDKNDSNDNYNSDYTDVSDISDISDSMVEIDVQNTAGPSRLPYA